MLTDLEKIVYLCERVADGAECAALWSVLAGDPAFAVEAIKAAPTMETLNRAHKLMVKTHARANKWLYTGQA